MYANDPIVPYIYNDLNRIIEHMQRCNVSYLRQFLLSMIEICLKNCLKFALKIAFKRFGKLLSFKCLTYSSL